MIWACRSYATVACRTDINRRRRLTCLQPFLLRDHFVAEHNTRRPGVKDREARKITTDGSAKSLRKAGLARMRLRDDEGKRQYVYIKGNNGNAGLTLIASARPRHRALPGRGRRRLASGGLSLILSPHRSLPAPRSNSGTEKTV